MSDPGEVLRCCFADRLLEIKVARAVIDLVQNHSHPCLEGLLVYIRYEFVYQVKSFLFRLGRRKIKQVLFEGEQRVRHTELLYQSRLGQIHEVVAHPSFPVTARTE